MKCSHPPWLRHVGVPTAVFVSARCPRKKPTHILHPLAFANEWERELPNEALLNKQEDAFPPEEQFYAHFEPLIRSIAVKIRTDMSLRMEMEDLIGFGFQGLMEARTRFDPSRGVKFKTFAYYRIRGAIIDGLRHVGWFPKAIHEKLKALDAANNILQQISVERGIAKSEKYKKEEILERLNQTVQQVTASFVISSLGQEEQSSGNPEESMIKVQSKDHIRKVIKMFPEKQRILIEGYYFENRTFEEISKELGISKSWASRLHSKTLLLLKKALSAEIALEDLG